MKRFVEHLKAFGGQMNRDIVTEMVADYFRTLIPAMQNGGPSAALETSSRFEQRLSQTASLMEPMEAAAFLQAVDAERERAITDYQANPAAFKRKLEVAMGVDGPVQVAPRLSAKAVWGL